MKNNKYLYQQIFKVVTTIMDMDKKEDFMALHIKPENS